MIYSKFNDLKLAGDLEVLGSGDFTGTLKGGTLEANDDAAVGGVLTVEGNVEVGGALAVEGNAAVDGTLNVTDLLTVSGGIAIEDATDADFAVTAADAASAATVYALANEIKTKYNALLAFLRTGEAGT